MMEVYFLGHGMGSSDESVGNLLVKSFADHEFSHFTCFVAFASVSGITGLADSIRNAKKHMRQFRLFIGIDQKGTSKEALEALLQLGVGIRIFYTFQRVIFHPKIYIFEGNTKCRIIIGSSNLTQLGLFQNIESSLVVDFERPDQAGERVLGQIYDYFESFFEKTANVRVLTQKLVDEFYAAGIIPNEIERKRTYDKETILKKPSGRDSVLKELKALFPSIKIQKIPAHFKPTKVARPKTFEIAPLGEDAWTRKGQLLWKKTNLPPSDVLYEKPGTHPTGGLRLVQAGWKVGGEKIDQTTYFRYNVFGSAAWKVIRTSPIVEMAAVLCNVKILGGDMGQHRLEIRHKPSGEAGQRNYTTLLSWGVLGKLIKGSRLKGRIFYLYAPESGEREPFYIEIK